MKKTTTPATRFKFFTANLVLPDSFSSILPHPPPQIGDCALPPLSVGLSQASLQHLYKGNNLFTRDFCTRNQSQMAKLD